jgi:D-galactarolactone isomerase
LCKGDYPHFSPISASDDADLLDLLVDWAPDDTTRRKILADNRAKVYGL